MKLHIIGAGTPTPSAKRFGTCYIVEVEDTLLMFDCGPASTHKMVQMGLWPSRVRHLFFSHHHFDHNADYPCFLLTRWDQSTANVEILKVYGPPPTRMFTEALIGEGGAFFPDWRARVEHPGSQEIYQARGGKLPRRPPTVDVQEIDSGESVTGNRWKVTGGRVKHIEPWMPTLAYRLEVGDISLVMTSDTGFCQGILDLARGTDYLLIHCWDLQARMQSSEADMITGTRAAAEIAETCGARKLLLSHLGPKLDRPADRERAIQEISSHFGGDFQFVDELSTLRLKRGRVLNINYSGE